MYSSTFQTKKDETSPFKKGVNNGTSKSKGSEISISALEVNVRPVLEYNAKLLNGKLIVII